jgi:hypothetical protein
VGSKFRKGTPPSRILLLSEDAQKVIAGVLFITDQRTLSVNLLASVNRGGGRDLLSYLLKRLQNNTIDRLGLSSEGNTNRHSYINGERVSQNTGDFYKKWGFKETPGSQSITKEKLTEYAETRIKTLSTETQSVFPLPLDLGIEDGNRFEI